jgi:hypothetical protein
MSFPISTLTPPLVPGVTCLALLAALIAGCGDGLPSQMLCAGGPSTSQHAVRTAEITVRLTKNGQAWSPAPTLQLRGTSARVDGLYGPPHWNTTGDGQGTYTVTVPHGTYDLLMNDGAGLADAVAKDVTVNGPATVTADYRTARVSGLVLLQGQLFPLEGGETVCAAGAASGTGINICTGLDRAGYFSLELPQGRELEVTWSRSGRMASTAAPGQVPFGSQVLVTRSFDRDEVLELDMNAPTLILRGRVSVDGGVRHLPVELTVGPVTLTIADDAASAFAVRLLAGTYSASLFASSGTPGHSGYWEACPVRGCTFAADAEMIVDVSSAAAPVGAVEGTLDFALPPGRSLALAPGQSAGQVLLSPVRDQVTLGFAAHVLPVDSDRRFRAPDVAYGTYAVRFEGSPLASAPGGFAELGTLVVDRAQVTWTKTVPLVPVVVDLTVNGKAMADDPLREGQQRGDLVFSPAEDESAGGRYTVDLGESGAARFERLMLPGRYRATIGTWTYLGRTHRQGYAQDVLPTGQRNLGVVEISDDPGRAGALRLPFDVAVQRARIQITDGARVTAGAPAKHTMVRLIDDAGNYAWAEVPADGGPVELDLYDGCYGVEVFGSDLAGYPEHAAFQGITKLGAHCTCAR